MPNRKIYSFVLWVLIAIGILLMALFAPKLSDWHADNLPINKPGPSGLPLEEFPSWLNTSYRNLSWDTQQIESKLNRAILEQSLDIGRQFLVNNQRSEGNFNYEYDFVRKKLSTDDNQVRQAGTLWGLALIYQFNRDPSVRDALDKGLDYLFATTREGPVEGSLLIAYPDTKESRTGTMALAALAIIEYLRTENTGSTLIDTGRRKDLSYHLSGYLKFLEYMNLGDGHFSEAIDINTGKRSHDSNPYFNGETLLCLIKAARYLGYTELIPLIDDTAMLMAKRYTIDAWREETDSPLTKGFYQWGSMAFWEYQDAGWKHKDLLGDCILVMAWWMINIHHTLARTRNTAYAYEGLIYAYQLARDRGLNQAAESLFSTIDRGLYKLTSWQVEGPLVVLNAYLLGHRTNDPWAIGGIMNHEAEAPLRIDVTQHQMHAVILALKYVYTASQATDTSVQADK